MAPPDTPEMAEAPLTRPNSSSCSSEAAEKLAARLPPPDRAMPMKWSLGMGFWMRAFGASMRRRGASCTANVRFSTPLLGRRASTVQPLSSATRINGTNKRGCMRDLCVVRGWDTDGNVCDSNKLVVAEHEDAGVMAMTRHAGSKHSGSLLHRGDAREGRDLPPAGCVLRFNGAA